MRRTADYRHDFTALYGIPGSCRVRVFEWGDDSSVEADEAVVVLTDEPNSIPSVRYSVEVIAADVFLRFALPTSATAVVEHHTRGWCERRGGIRPETFDLVTFEVDEPEHREVSPGRFAAALAGPEHHLLSFDVLDELVGAGLLHGVEDCPSQGSSEAGR